MPHLPTGYLTTMAARHPGCWRKVDDLRARRGRDLPAWPSWCYLPMAGSLAVLSGGADLTTNAAIAIAQEALPFAALAAWRPTQGIYEFHPAVRTAIEATPLDGELPTDVLHRLPEWCVYLRTPGLQLGPWSPAGAFAFLEWDANTGREELRLAIDSNDDIRSLPPIHLQRGGIAAGIEAAYEDARARERKTGCANIIPPGLPSVDEWARLVSPLVSLVLYLCAENSDIRHPTDAERRPQTPTPTKTKAGLRLFPPPRPTTWQVAFRPGAALESAPRDREEPQGDHHASPRAHFRRAHWNTYWTGPRSGTQSPVLRWLPPTLVGAGDVVPTIRPVGADDPALGSPRPDADFRPRRLCSSSGCAAGPPHRPAGSRARCGFCGQELTLTADSSRSYFRAPRDGPYYPDHYVPVNTAPGT